MSWGWEQFYMIGVFATLGWSAHTVWSEKDSRTASFNAAFALVVIALVIAPIFVLWREGFWQ